MKSKPLMLIWTDLALLALFALLASSGAILRWVLPPGSGGGGRAGGHAAQARFLDLSRHEWGDVHFWIAAIMVGIILIHLALHWGWLKTWVLRILRIRTHDAPRAGRSAPAPWAPAVADRPPPHRFTERS